MKDTEKANFLKTLDKRTRLWELKRDNAKLHMETETKKANAMIDLQVAESALERIATKKKELIGETAHKLLIQQPTRLFKALPRKTKTVKAEVEEEKEDTKNAV